MAYKIISKKLDRKTRTYLFTLQTLDEVSFERYALEIKNNKKLLFSLNKEDLFEVAFTLGFESILNELQQVKELKKKPESRFL